MRKILLAIIVCFCLSGCGHFDGLSGGARYCDKCDATWHTHFGETHECDK